jgi:hypothetical protein
MAILNLSVSDELDKKFREAASTHFGNKKGNLAKAATEGLGMWIELSGLCKAANITMESAMALLKEVLSKVTNADQPEA